MSDNFELDPTTIEEINGIRLPRLIQLLYIEGTDPRDTRFKVSFPEGLTENTVEHVYINFETGEKTVLLRQSEEDELKNPLPLWS